MALNDLTDPSAVTRAMAEYDELGRPAFLRRYGYGTSREYMLRGPSGNMYDSKAIAGVAYGIQFPERGPLRSVDFSGGENTVERKLEQLGFEVVRIGQDWSREEVELVVSDYLDMLALDAAQSPYKKTEHNERLRSYLRARSKGSIELKHANISAVLDDLGLPYIKGYLPRGNYQQLLRTVVLEAIKARRKELSQIMDTLQSVPSPIGSTYQSALVAAPRGEIQITQLGRARLPRKFDYAARDESNRQLGRAGEEWTLGYENYRLKEGGRPDLVKEVEWVSDTQGDGLGYDISSFELNEATRYIEVKTTNGPAASPFVVSRNEVEFSREAGPAFFLYRVFNYSSDPKLFLLKGDLSDSLLLTPLDYRARIKTL